MLLSKGFGLRSGAGGSSSGVRGVKCGLLASASVAALLLAGAGSAGANDVTVGGVPSVFNLPSFISVTSPAANTVITVNTQDITPGGAFGGVEVSALNASNSVTVDAGRSVTALAHGIYVTSAAGAITVVDNGTVSGGFSGAYLNSGFAADGGNIDLSGSGTLQGSGQAGAWLITDTGSVKMDGFSTIKGATWGILVNSNGSWLGAPLGTKTGDVNLGMNTPLGDVTGVTVGIEVLMLANSNGDGDININATNVTGTGLGIKTTDLTGDTSITATGAVKAVGPGIWSISSTGDVTATGGGTGTVESTAGIGVTQNPTTTGNAETSAFASIIGYLSGIWQVTGTGDATVADVGTVTGKTVDGILITTGTGNVSVQNTGNIGGITGSGLDGINVISGTGNIDIGGTKTNGVIEGLRNGIWTATTGAGTNTVTVDKNVTGTTLNGIIATSAAGDTTVDIAAGATVQGLLDGVATGTVGGTATTTNAGIVKNINDTGAANTAGLIAFQALSGTNVLDNTGDIIGGINTAGIKTTVNNDAGGVWIASLANAMAAPTTINNAGLIDIRTGATVLSGNSTLNNQAGGVVDLTYGGSGAAANALDSLTVLNFSPDSGSIEKFNVDFTQANLAGDVSTNNGGNGTADTIIVTGKSTPAAASIVDLSTLGEAKTGSSGSIALVNAVAGGLADPGLGGMATMVASDNYVMANDPSGGAVVYKLVEDSNGGVYLQWAPNVSAASLGGFGGAVGVGSGPGAPSAGTAIAAASGGMGSGGFGLSGGPGGGGAAGAVGDLAAGDVGSSTPQRGSIKDDATSNCSGDGKRFHGWAQVGAGRGSSEGGGSGRATNVSAGTETGATIASNRGCDRVAVGVFGYKAGPRRAGSPAAPRVEPGHRRLYPRLDPGRSLRFAAGLSRLDRGEAGQRSL